MPTVGEQLRAARERRNLRVQEVAEATNMRTDHIIALEEGNYTPFPAPVYIRGSIRTYAKLLQLDVMKVMEDLTAEMNEEANADGSTDSPRHHRGLVDLFALQLVRFGWKRTAVVVVLLTIFVVALLMRSADSEVPAQDPLADLPPPTYQPGNSSESGYLPLPGTNQ